RPHALPLRGDGLVPGAGGSGIGEALPGQSAVARRRRRLLVLGGRGRRRARVVRGPRSVAALDAAGGAPPRGRVSMVARGRPLTALALSVGVVASIVLGPTSTNAQAG